MKQLSGKESSFLSDLEDLLNKHGVVLDWHDNSGELGESIYHVIVGFDCHLRCDEIDAWLKSREAARR